MRVVIDTNLWVSGLLWRGLPGRLLRLAQAGQIELCLPPQSGGHTPNPVLSFPSSRSLFET